MIRSVSPQTKEVIGEFPCATPAEVELAVAHAWQTFRNNRLDLKSRIACVSRLRTLIADQADEIAKLISKEVGKPLVECYSAELTGVLDTCVWLIDNAERLLATERVKLTNPLARKKRCSISYEPLGVIGIISPWNFPFTIPMCSVLHAVVAGNCVVLKPSEKSSMVGLKIAELCKAAGFPEGTVNVVLGERETGKALSQSPHLSRLILTGSVGAGKAIMAQAAGNLTPMTLELGGKDAAVVLPDAPVEYTARGLVWGAFTNAGQACASIERVYIVRGPNTEALIGEITRLTKQLRVGPPEDPNVDIGPVIDGPQLEKICHQLADAMQNGAKLLHGGKTLTQLNGFFIEPTVLTDVNHNMMLMKEETFGPVLPIMVVESADEAIRLANDTGFGLTASLWSANAEWVEQNLAPLLRAGTVYVNECIFSHAAPQLPWGGVGMSGIGRSHGRFGLHDMVNIKNTNVETAKGSGALWWYPYGPGRTAFMRGGVQYLHGATFWKRLKGAVSAGYAKMFSVK